MTEITIIAFGKDDNELDRDSDFIRSVSDVTVVSLLALAKDPAKHAHADIVDIRGLRAPESYPQYAGYSAVYFLNEAALKMCREAGIELNVIGSASAMPEESSFQLQAHYLPQS